LTTTGPVMVQFMTMIEEEVRDGEAYGVFDLIAQAVDIGVPSQEIPEAVVAWSWGAADVWGGIEGTPQYEAEWTRFNEGPESKWNDHRYMSARFPEAYGKGV
tara:strand:+ start:820 stop:1125 length:306 start_codon:yes stop_codon:yes gene_type:complete